LLVAPCPAGRRSRREITVLITGLTVETVFTLVRAYPLPPSTAGEFYWCTWEMQILNYTTETEQWGTVLQFLAYFAMKF
jgi:hypothetical protein